MENLHVSEVAAADQTKYSRVRTKVFVMRCNWILFLGTALDTCGIREAAGTAGFPNMNLPSPTLAHEVCVHDSTKVEGKA